MRGSSSGPRPASTPTAPKRRPGSRSTRYSSTWTGPTPRCRRSRRSQTRPPCTPRSSSPRRAPSTAPRTPAPAGRRVPPADGARPAPLGRPPSAWGTSREPGAGAHDAADPELGVEFDEIGTLARRDPATVRDAEQGERVAAGGGGGGGGGGARAPPPPPPAPPAPPAPIAHPGERDGIADEQQPVRRLQPRDERPQRGMNMDLVGDELDVGRGVEQGGHGDARRTGVA